MTTKENRQFDCVGEHIVCDAEKCTGCELCIYACSFRNGRGFGPAKSMIRVVHLHPLLHLAVSCQHCKDPDCVRVCPPTALSQSKETGVIQVDREKCTACGWCVNACPYGAMDLDADKLVVFTCDLCDGQEGPVCIEWCPNEALVKGDVKTFREKVNAYIEKNRLAEYPEMKRFLNPNK